MKGVFIVINVESQFYGDIGVLVNIIKKRRPEQYILDFGLGRNGHKRELAFTRDEINTVPIPSV